MVFVVVFEQEKYLKQKKKIIIKQRKKKHRNIYRKYRFKNNYKNL